MILESMDLILIPILIVGMIFINFSPQFGAKTTGVNSKRIKSSNNFKNGNFRNIKKTAIMTKMDLTFLKCGQYDEGWAEIHMMPEETVQAHIDLRGELLMPIHWGAFKLSIHTWQESVEKLLLKANPLKVK